MLRKAIAISAVLVLAAVAFALRQARSPAGTKVQVPQQQTRNQTMDHQLTRYWADAPVEVAELTAIRPAAAPASLSRAASDGTEQISQQFVNPERNSRVGAAVGDLSAPWRVKWRTEIEDIVQPSVVLVSSDRVLAYGEAAWQLLDRSGKSLRQGPVQDSGITLDPERSLFYGVDQFGLISARNLTDGSNSFTMMLRQTTKFARRMIVRRGPRLFTLGYEIPIDPHSPDPEYSIAEATDVHDPASRKSWKEPGGPSVVQDLVAHTILMLGAMHDDYLVLALKNAVYVANSALEVRQGMTGTFSPATLSLDEDTRIYLIVQNGAETALWLLRPDGERIYSFTLPPGIPSLIAPPIVGYNHMVYLIGQNYVFAVAQDGKLEWSRQAAAPIAGAVVTSDDQLLTSEGSQVVAWNLKGERHVLHNFPEELSTAPILTKNGELFVASHASVFCATR
jgi:hypothetical protein